MNTHYHLQPYGGRSTRHECPRCHDKHSFTYYVDDEGNPLSEICGRCDHESRCGYHYTPGDYFRDSGNIRAPRHTTYRPYKAVKRNEVQPDYLDRRQILKYRSFDNQLMYFLVRKFDVMTLESPTIEKMWKDYIIGATPDKDVVFWYLDIDARLRTGKIIRYNPLNGHRDKSHPIDWIHSRMKKSGELPQDFNMVQCLFGEHLLRLHPDKTVAVVESEKTAVICSALIPEYVWVATGGKSNIREQTMRVLRGRNVILFPDIDGYREWTEKSRMLSRISSSYHVSDCLERYGTDEDRAGQVDIADILLRDLPRIRSPGEEAKTERGTDAPAVQTAIPSKAGILTAKNPELKELVEELDLVLN